MTDLVPGAVAETSRPRRLPWSIVVPFAFGAVYLAWRLRAEATIACDVGVNAGSAMMGLTLATPFLVLGCVVVGGVWRHVLPVVTALLAMLASNAVVIAVTLSVTAPSPDYPDGGVVACAGGHPSWWPGWLPG